MRYDVGETGRRLRALREDRGWSQRQLARRTAAAGQPVSHSSVADMEKGRTQRLALELLESLAQALGVTLHDLLDPSAPPPAAFDTGGPAVSNGGPPTLSSSGTGAGARDSGGGKEAEAQPSDPQGGAVGSADADEGGAGRPALGGPLPVVVYRGYVLGERDDPRDRATWDDALGASRRRTLAVSTHTTQAVGAPEGGAFAVDVPNSSLSHVATEAGVVGPGWTLYVNTADAALRHAPDRVVVAMAHGELVAGFLERDPDAPGGFLVVDAHRRHPVSPDDVLGVVVLLYPPRQTLTWRAAGGEASGPGPTPQGPAYMGVVAGHTTRPAPVRP